MLGDIVSYCKHYHSFEEANGAWKRRKDRIDWNHVYFMMTDRDFTPPVAFTKTIQACEEDVIQRFDSLPFQNKICIVQNPAY